VKESLVAEEAEFSQCFADFCHLRNFVFVQQSFVSTGPAVHELVLFRHNHPLHFLGFGVGPLLSVDSWALLVEESEALAWVRVFEIVHDFEDLRVKAYLASIIYRNLVLC